MPSSDKHVLYYVTLTSLIVALLYFFGFFDLLGYTKSVICGFLVGLIMTVFPDVDSPSSKIRRYVTLISLASIICFTIAYYYLQNLYLLAGIVFTATLLLIITLSKHRSFLHTTPVAIILCLPIFYFDVISGVFALWGYLLHIILDKL